ncbi:MAG: hypothetical protein ABGX16_10040, partial [Pirellulales bacterium]
TSVGPLHFQGRYGLLRMVDSQPVAAHLVGGNRLSAGSIQLKSAPVHRGTIIDVQPHTNVKPCADGQSYGYFDIDQRIAPLQGTTLIVHHPDGSTQAYSPTRLEPIDSGTRIYVSEDAGFAYSPKGIHTTRYPQRHFEGNRSRYEILTATHYSE